MIAEHSKEMHDTALEVLPPVLRNCQESGIALLAIGIGVAVHRLTRSPARAGEPRAARQAPATARAAVKVARRHAAAIGQVIGRLASAAILG